MKKILTLVVLLGFGLMVGCHDDSTTKNVGHRCLEDDDRNDQRRRPKSPRRPDRSCRAFANYIKGSSFIGTVFPLFLRPMRGQF